MVKKSYKSPKTELRPSPLGGQGLFAKENIKKGELVFIKSGQRLSLEEANRFNKELGVFSIQIDDAVHLGPTNEQEVKDTVIFINHSCDPNVGVDGSVKFVAMRDIKAGEELFYDYAMTETHPWEMPCHCGTKHCRKVVTGDDWKRKDLQKRYGSNFSDYILKKMRKNK
jgi:SET domain-containing protein